MIIPKNLTLDRIEDILLRIGDADAETVRLPSKISFGGSFGVDTALLQLLVTWSRRQAASCLHLYCPTEEIVGFLEDFSSQPYALAALVMAKRIQDEAHNEIKRFDALRPAFEIVDAMYKGNLSATMGGKGHRPNAVSLMSIGNAEREFIKPLYSTDSLGSVRTPSEFVDLLKDSLTTLLGRRDAQIGNKDFAEPLGSLVYELFANTDQHATTDLNGNIHSRSVRGVIIKKHMVTTENVSKFGGENPHFNRYFSKVNARNSGTNLQAIEISIFDSGPGLAQRWISQGNPTEPRDLTIDEEFKATKDCFEKYFTTKKTLASGMGLFQVLQVLGFVGGFLRIRTGRTCLFQTFDGGSKKEVSFQPKSWYENKPLANVAGSLFTICIPI